MILRVVLCIGLLTLAGCLLVVGWLGWTQRLPRNGFAGVRTTSALRDDASWRLANRVAGLPVLIGGAVLVVGAVLALLMPSAGGVVAAAVITAIGGCAISAAGGVLGHRAASAPSSSTPSSCAGCACGVDSPCALREAVTKST